VTDRIRSDGTAVETIRATVARSGGTRRPEVRLPPDRADAIAGDVARITIDGSEYHAPVAEGSGTTALRGAYANPRRAREREGTDHLAAWVEDRGIGFGRSVLVDVVVPGEQFGLRAPGEEAVYEVRAGASSDLRDIARDLEGT
jgi:hypothetical protein